MSLERARQAALVQAALRGDEHAREELGALAEEYLRRCFFRHARRCYGDGVKEELEDIASDAVEKCLARLDRFQGGRALFTTWVYGFAKNVLRNHHRKRARRDQIWEEVRKDQSAWWHEPPPDEPHFGGDPLRWVIHQEKLEALHLAMADLPVNDEVILTLRVAKARPEAETARQLYIHRNTLVYRLDKLQKSTGLDIRVFEDAITFKIALMVVRYMKYMETLEY